MNERYDVDGAGRSDGGGLDVRDLLEEASWVGVVEDLDADGAWRAGRRRRTLRRAGAGTLAGVAATSALVLGWQAGALDGRDAQEPTVAAVPAGWTTFVLAAPGGPEVGPATTDPVSVPDEAALRGTTWDLLPALHETGTDTGAVVPAAGETTFSFAPEGDPGWGFEVAGCGGGWFSSELTLDAEGRFPPGDPVTTDIGCSEEVQQAEDLWLAALGGGGALRTVGDGRWLLLSVDLPEGGAAPLVTGDPEPTGDPGEAAPDPDAPDGTAAEDPGEAVPVPGPQEPPVAVPPPAPSPTGPTDPADSGADPAEPGADPEDPPAPPSPPSTDPPPPADDPVYASPTEVSLGQPWPDGSGQLLAPTVRAGLNDGFDRVVVDLTGTGVPGWRAAYPEVAVRDGSGLPAGVAGDSVLEVVLSGMAYPEPGDPVYDAGDAGLDTHTLDGVVEVLRTTPFEGHLQLFVGVAGEPRPYRVFLLQDPLRLVVDVQHTG
ncbi:MAG TPA: hypothetical protein VLO09_09585 [Ornithinimicrobium sp.]|nr:hypothetical protein [Ornithinimicrobium sp.]